MKLTIAAAAALIGLATAFGPVGAAPAAQAPDGTPVIEVGGRHSDGYRSSHRYGDRSGPASSRFRRQFIIRSTSRNSPSGAVTPRCGAGIGRSIIFGSES